MALSHRTVGLALALSACACLAFPQQGHQTRQGTKLKAAWKEYVYPVYGFAITVPRVPKETPIKNGAQYRLYWDEKTNAVVNLMAYQSPTDCSAWLAWARNTFKDANSTRVITMKGMPTIEGDANRNSLQAGYQRRHCVNGRMYSFEAGWPKDQGKPPIVGRIMDSFRLLREKSGASQSK